MQCGDQPVRKSGTERKRALMDAVVRLVADGGVENVSTRSVIAEAEDVTTDVYLYRLFGSKEKLLLQTFFREDARLAEETECCIELLCSLHIGYEARLLYLWQTLWSWLTVGHPDTCRFLARYYFSSFYGDEARSAHRVVWRPAVDRLKSLIPGIDAAHMTDTLFGLLLTLTFQTCERLADDEPEDMGFRIFREMLDSRGVCPRTAAGFAPSDIAAHGFDARIEGSQG